MLGAPRNLGLETSAWTIQFGVYFHNRRLEVLKQMLGNLRSTSALDIGCGEGYLADMGIRSVVGIDTRPTRGVALYASAEDLPFQDESFDLVFAGEIIEHLDRPGKALREWARVMKTGGTMILSTLNGVLVSPVGGNPDHKRTYAPTDVRTALNNLGLIVSCTRGIFTGLVSGKKVFRALPFTRLKIALLRFPVPLALSYDVFFKAEKSGS